MPDEHMGGMPQALIHTQFAGSLYFRHQGPSGTFDALCVPPTPDVPGNNMYWDTMPNDKALLTRIGEALSLLGAVRGYLPHAYTMTGRVGTRCELQGAVIATPSRIPLYFTSEVSARMDGLELEPGDGAVFALGGCGIGIGARFVAHCARDSLIDRSVLAGTGASREHFSVVEAMAHRAQYRSEMPLSDEPFSVLFAIPAACYGHPLTHDEYGRFNQRMLTYAEGVDQAAVYVRHNQVHLSIGGLAAAQALHCGFRTARAACTLPADGAFAHTRHPNPAMRIARNITVVVRRH